MIALVNYQAMFTYSFASWAKRRRTNRHLLSNNHIFHNHLVSSCCLRSHSSLVLFQRLWLQSQYWGCAFIVCSNSRVNKSVNSKSGTCRGCRTMVWAGSGSILFWPVLRQHNKSRRPLACLFLRTDETGVSWFRNSVQWCMLFHLGAWSEINPIIAFCFVRFNSMMRRKVVFMGMHSPPNWLRNLRNSLSKAWLYSGW